MIYITVSGYGRCVKNACSSNRFEIAFSMQAAIFKSSADVRPLEDTDASNVD